MTHTHKNASRLCVTYALNSISMAYVVVQARRDVRALDSTFYEHMVEQFRRGELDEEGLSDMLDEHLNHVEAYRRRLREKQRRKHKPVGGASGIPAATEREAAPKTQAGRWRARRTGGD